MNWPRWSRALDPKYAPPASGYAELIDEAETPRYMAISLDEDYPRVYFTREKHRPGRAYAPVMHDSSSRI